MMKKILCVVLALMLFLSVLTGCRKTPEGELPTQEDQMPQTVPVVPQETMPTKPEADYQLPPGEKPGSGNIQTH